MPPRCKVTGCGKAVLARGWCNAHWKRWRAYGDPLGGGTSRGECLRYLRDVLIAYDGDECRCWPFARSADGYGRVRYDGNVWLVHRLICQEVNGNPPTPKHEAAHSCGNGDQGCCTKWHLSWKTSKENHADKIIHDTHTRGERCPTSKLTEPEARRILALKGTMSQREIGETFNVSRAHVGAIHRGEWWAWLN